MSVKVRKAKQPVLLYSLQQSCPYFDWLCREVSAKICLWRQGLWTWIWIWSRPPPSLVFDNFCNEWLCSDYVGQGINTASVVLTALFLTYFIPSPWTHDWMVQWCLVYHLLKLSLNQFLQRHDYAPLMVHDGGGGGQSAVLLVLYFDVAHFSIR